MITWKHVDGRETIIDAFSTAEDLLKVCKEALRSLKGQAPSINSSETIDELLDLLNDDEYFCNI